MVTVSVSVEKQDAWNIVTADQQRLIRSHGSGNTTQVAIADKHRWKPQRPVKVGLRSAWLNRAVNSACGFQESIRAVDASALVDIVEKLGFDVGQDLCIKRRLSDGENYSSMPISPIIVLELRTLSVAMWGLTGSGYVYKVSVWTSGA